MASSPYYQLGPEEEFLAPDQGSYTKLAANPEADARWARAFELDKRFNEQALQRQLEEKQQRFLNSALGAYYSGDNKGLQQAGSGFDTVSKTLQGRGEIDAANLQSQLQALSKRAEIESTANEGQKSRNNSLLEKLLEMQQGEYERGTLSAGDKAKAFATMLGGEDASAVMLDSVRMKQDYDSNFQAMKAKYPDLEDSEIAMRVRSSMPEANYYKPTNQVMNEFTSAVSGNGQPASNPVLLELIKALLPNR
jgi:hypothetical protein